MINIDISIIKYIAYVLLVGQVVNIVIKDVFKLQKANLDKLVEKYNEAKSQAVAYYDLVCADFVIPLIKPIKAFKSTTVISILLVLLVVSLVLSFISGISFILIALLLITLCLTITHVFYVNKAVTLTDTELSSLLYELSKIYKTEPNLKHAIIEMQKITKDNHIKLMLGKIIQYTQGGYTTSQSALEVAKQSNNRNFKFIATAIKLNESIGGNLPNLLNQSSKILKRQITSAKEIKNIMYQTKTTAIITSSIVPLIVFIQLIFGKSANSSIDANTFKIIYIVVTIWWIIGVILANQTVKIRPKGSANLKVN